MLIYGINAINAVLEKRKNAFENINYIKTNNPKINEIITKATKNGIKVNEVEDLGDFNHQKVTANIKPKPNKTIDEVLDSNFLLILDGVTDVRNLGAIIRTAAAFKVGGIILPKDRSALITSDVYKTSSGAVEYIDIITETNLSRTIQKLKDSGFWIYGFEKNGKTNLDKLNFDGKVVCVMGGEDTGIRELTLKNCDFVSSIPIASDINSLNVSVASSIVIYEVLRQKGFKI